jgi:hypothetical protein
MAKTFNDLIDKAALFVEQPFSFSKDNFIKEVEEYIQSLPESRRNAIIGFIGPTCMKAVKYSELPNVLRSDEDFFRRYVNALAKMKKLSIKK